MTTSWSAVHKSLKLQALALGLLGVAACSGELASSAGPFEYTLSVTPPTGGTITSADGSINCPGQCEVSRPPGTLLRLTANSDSGALFDLWTEGCTGLTLPTCDVLFATPVAAAARFMSCADKRQNGAETDIDCGGPLCGPCAAGSACKTDQDCAAGLTCANNACAVICNASSVTVLGNRSPTITPAAVPAGSSATVLCRYPTYQFLFDKTVVQDFTTNNAAKEQQAISCRSDGAWYTPNGEKFNTLNCVGFAPCNGCVAPGTDSGAPADR